MSLLYTDRFTYFQDTKSLVAEASELGGIAPENFRLRSHWTGKTIDVLAARCEKDNEGDVLAWHYVAPAVPGLSITIFND